MLSQPTTLAFFYFDQPGYLALLAVLPLLVALSVRSLAGLGAARRLLAITLRCAVVLLMVLALAGAHRRQRIDDLAVLFLMDRSRSVPAELQRAAFDYLTKAGTQRKGGDRVGVIAFDGAAAVEQLPMRAVALDQLGAPLDPDQTNLAAAARLAAALLPADAAGRLVLVSDGNENAGDVRQEAVRLRAAGVPIDILPIQYEHTREVVFETLKTPATATSDETINLNMTLRAERATVGEILLWHNDKLVDLNGPADGTGFAVELQAGANRLVRQVPLRIAGAHRFRTQFVPARAADDTIPDNNGAEAFTVVSGQGRILLLTTARDLADAQPSAEILSRALESEGLVCEVDVAGRQPLDQVQLTEYALVVLANVPAGDFRADEKKALAVRPRPRRRAGHGRRRRQLRSRRLARQPGRRGHARQLRHQAQEAVPQGRAGARHARLRDRTGQLHR